MAADEADIVAERQDLVTDGIEQLLVIATRQVGASDRAVEENVADMDEILCPVEVDDMAGCVAGAAGELHLNEQALAFMHAHAARLTERPMRPVLGEPLFVEGMTGFVQHTHQRGEEFIGAVARGHAHVGGHAAAEGVVGDSQ